MSVTIEMLEEKIALLEKRVATETGKALASARQAQQAERDAAKVKAEAQAYRDETDAMIVQAGTDMRIAYAINAFVYRLGQMFHEQAVEVDLAGRLVFREARFMDQITELVALVPKAGRTPQAEGTIRNAEKTLEIWKKNGEALKVQQAQALIVFNKAAAKSDIDQAVATLRANMKPEPEAK